MSDYFHLRAVPPSALRNSANWLQRLFEDDWDAVRERIGRHREEVLDKSYLDHELLYAGAEVVLGGLPVHPGDRDKPPFLLLTAARANQVSSYLGAADFETLWRLAREELLPRYGGACAEREARGVFAAAHRDLTAFYGQTARYGDAVVKWLVH
ncbi:DUF1877 domain-containing protein [Streptomyces griseorubiginosus]|uniref:DUF1877 domain-containing protein n=1 Tax=Streptomyces griseorubiginosus TaxID=67304 RepID=UPI002E81904E|nr:DUF1877 domain-containing protein [Streptomyces griseorubiginosus]WUB44765.1 YfbM family protein [Streptomyces griseorubiginosus]WUB53282.1 YfbM family protein [Streptomyces griseorubiginosus]